jgi:hypothetical protein
MIMSLQYFYLIFIVVLIYLSCPNLALSNKHQKMDKQFKHPHSAGGPQHWPDLVGKSYEEAAAEIQNQRSEVHIFKVAEVSFIYLLCLFLRIFVLKHTVDMVAEFAG